MIHRLREWNDGDTLYGAVFLGDRSPSGKTFRAAEEPAEDRARDYYNRDIFNGPGTTAVLYRATVRNPRTDPQNPADPGEPPLKQARLEDVEILDHDPADE